MTTSPTSTGAELLPPHVLDSLGGLDLIAREVVRGFVSGLHLSPFLGGGEDFARHRAYQQGDDLRLLDWRLFGRSDRLYVRQYTEHSNLQAYLLLDTSESMAFQDRPEHLSKIRYAAILASVLAHLMLRAGDAVGLAESGSEVRLQVPARSRAGQLVEILHVLHRMESRGSGSLERALERVGEALPRCGRVILISDLLCPDDGAGLTRAIGRLRARGDEVMVFRVLTPMELGRSGSHGVYFDPEGNTAGRTDHRAGDPGSDLGYRDRVESYYRRLEDRILEQGGEYVELDVTVPLGHALRRWAVERGGGR